MLKLLYRNLLNARTIGGILLTGLTLSACQGGSKEAPSDYWRMGTHHASRHYQDFCENPRSGIHPYTNRAYPDKAGSTALENHFLRAWTHESYLWYQEVPDLNPNNYDDTLAYFNLQKTNELTANGTEKDRFHFTQDEISGDQFTYTGQRGGYGISWKFSGSRELYVSFVEPNSPASDAGISRGMELTHVNGNLLTELTNEQIADANQAIFSPLLETSATFQFTPTLGDAVTHTLEAANVTVSAVLKHSILNTESGDVGYLVFNTFNTFTAESQLKAAFDDFASNGIDDLVVDLRYNGGGYLYIAAQLAYLVAGDSNTAGETFTVLQYNDKRSNSNVEYEFVNRTQNTGMPSEVLTSVNLNRVYVLTTGSTCSASESFINGLRGAGIEVIQIGSITCGKPHGFNAQTNCGTRYFSIDFESVNGQGFGEYIDGFEPVASGGNPLTNKVNGCNATDDLAYPLGNPNEGMLSIALNHRVNGTCTLPSSAQQKPRPSLLIDGEFFAPPSDKILRLAPEINF